jgi:hypothetical protein
VAKQGALPRVHVLIVCDDVEDRADEETSFNLYGVRADLAAPRFPCIHPALWVYLQVTAHPRTAIGQVVLVDGNNDEEIAASTAEPIELTGPLDFLHLFFCLLDCVFPQPGVYYFQVYFEGKLVGERAFHVVEQEFRSNGQTT